MQNIKAVGFDLFNTLITMETIALKDAMVRLTNSLREMGLNVAHESFVQAYREAVLQFLQQTKRDGKESHNRFWISTALAKQGLSVSPEDPDMSAAVESYFSAFVQYTKLIPGTKEMLGILQERYRIGLLSNFTHPPAAKNIMSELGLTPFFEVVLISGDLGYRKPHGSVFEKLIDQLGVQRDEIAFVGDDPEADVTGALGAGLKPIWTTYVRDNHIAPAPGMLGPTEEEADPTVPRISDWQDLLVMLEVE
jgi:HAD superfamily hydrolase (TIGR01549 family)